MTKNEETKLMEIVTTLSGAKSEKAKKAVNIALSIIEESTSVPQPAQQSQQETGKCYAYFKAAKKDGVTYYYPMVRYRSKNSLEVCIISSRDILEIQETPGTRGMVLACISDSNFLKLEETLNKTARAAVKELQEATKPIQKAAALMGNKIDTRKMLSEEISKIQKKVKVSSVGFTKEELEA